MNVQVRVCCTGGIGQGPFSSEAATRSCARRRLRGRWLLPGVRLTARADIRR